jgi:hypothetical protein
MSKHIPEFFLFEADADLQLQSLLSGIAALVVREISGD